VSLRSEHAPNALLSLRGVSVRRDGRDIVRDCGFDVRSGELIAIVGPNGAGKSTLMKAIAGLLPHGGQISLQGQALTNRSHGQHAGRLAYLPQDGRIHWPMKVEDVVALGRLPFARPLQQVTDEDRRCIKQAMERCDIAHLAERSAAAVSGGELARVLLARAMATNASILLADEPFAALDPKQRLTAMRQLHAYADGERAVVVITHHLDLAMDCAARLVTMKDGNILGDDTPLATLNAGALDAAFGVRFEPLFNGSNQLAGLGATADS